MATSENRKKPSIAGLFARSGQKKKTNNCINHWFSICAVTKAVIRFYFSSVRVFKFSVGVFKITQGYSNRRKCRKMGVFRSFPRFNAGWRQKVQMQKSGYVVPLICPERRCDFTELAKCDYENRIDFRSQDWVFIERYHLLQATKNLRHISAAEAQCLVFLLHHEMYNLIFHADVTGFISGIQPSAGM